MPKNYFTYGDNNEYNCVRCRWQGGTPEIIEGNGSDRYYVYNVHCPSCKKWLCVK